MPTQILTIGKVTAVTFLHLPMQGKVTFVDILDIENPELLFRYVYASPKFRKFAETLALGTFVVAEGDISHHKIQTPRNDTRSILMVAGKVLRVLHRSPISEVPTKPNENAPT